jgi:RNA polymerase sigma factor (sigma-70 family)
VGPLLDDPGACFDWLYGRYERTVVGIAVNCLRLARPLAGREANEAAAEDVVQDAWRRVWQALLAGKWDGNLAGAKGWLGRIVQNLVRDQTRRAFRQVPAKEGEEGAREPRRRHRATSWRYVPRPEVLSLEGLPDYLASGHGRGPGTGAKRGPQRLQSVQDLSGHVAPFPWGGPEWGVATGDALAEAPDPADVVGAREEAAARRAHLRRLLSRVSPAYRAWLVRSLTVSGAPGGAVGAALSRYGAKSLGIQEEAERRGVPWATEKTLRDRARDALEREARRDPWPGWVAEPEEDVA